MRSLTERIRSAIRSPRARVAAYAGALALLGSVTILATQSANAAERMISQNVDERAYTRLPGMLRRELTPTTDRGAVSDNLTLEHVYLQLNRSAAKSAAADALIDELHDPKSAQFHRWLSSEEVAARFGPDAEDAAAVSNWLTSHGMTVHNVYGANGVIDFSASAGAIREAFHTEIHRLVVNGHEHIANVSLPSVPKALAPAIGGILALHDFMPHTALQPRAAYTVNSSYQLVVPGDLETIYNINPLYARGVAGQGQTVVVLEDTDLYTTDDWHAFRQTFGLDRKYGRASIQQVHPQPSHNPNNGGACADPGVNGDDGEAAVDVEWASAAAPAANIVLASCADTNANFGGFIALQNLLTGHGNPPSIISLSYGESESGLGSAFNQYISQLYQLANFEGVSLFVSSGDAGADSSEQFAPAATAGLNVSGFATTPYNVAVGGTDFADAFLGENSNYWNATNKTDYSSALSYIPEIPWNDSCASELITAVLGFTVPYGPSGSCNNAPGNGFLGVVAGSGGPSSCAYGNSPNPGIVQPNCSGYRKPRYQYGLVGNPRDGVRDIPDVSLFAADGVWGHYYVICYSDPTPGYHGNPCTGAPDTWSGGGGTSFAAPIMAGIQALVNQTSGNYQGNPDYVYYWLADQEYGNHGNGNCNSTLGNQVGSGCVFYDVTLGDNDVNCTSLVYQGAVFGTFDCFLDGATNGVLSLSNDAYQPTYITTTGYDFPTGIGTVNAYNLVRHWPGSRLGGGDE